MNLQSSLFTSRPEANEQSQDKRLVERIEAIDAFQLPSVFRVILPKNCHTSSTFTLHPTRDALTPDKIRQVR